jgi:hypothetical protein
MILLVLLLLSLLLLPPSLSYPYDVLPSLCTNMTTFVMTIF